MATIYVARHQNPDNAPGIHGWWNCLLHVCQVAMLIARQDKLTWHDRCFISLVAAACSIFLVTFFFGPLQLTYVQVERCSSVSNGCLLCSHDTRRDLQQTFCCTLQLINDGRSSGPMIAWKLLIHQEGKIKLITVALCAG